MKLASIIILTYNNFDNLIKNLQSCFEQNYPMMEIILRDDGSKNYNETYVQRIFESCPKRINYKIIHSEVNQGTVRNFNQAIEESLGDVIISLAGDDYFKNSYSVSKIMDIFNASDECDCLLARQRHIYEDGQSIMFPSVYEENLVKQKKYQKLWYLISVRPCFMVGSASYYSRKILMKYGCFDENYRLLEDWPFYLKLLENNEKIHFLSHETIVHQSGGVSTAENNYRNTFLVKDDIKCINYVIKHAKRMKLGYIKKRALIYRYFALVAEKEHRKIDKKIKFKYIDVCAKNWLWFKLRNMSFRLELRGNKGAWN